MKIMKILFLAVLILFSACYEDKGNYDYASLNEVEISRTSYSIFRVSLGETVTIEPEITCSKGEKGKEKLTYSWVLDGELVSEEPVFEWKAMKYTSNTSGNLLFTVTDTETGLKYYAEYTVKVIERYEGTGVFVLAKNRTTGQLDVHMVKNTDRTENEQTIIDYTPFLNIYSQANGGEFLPTSTFKMHEHYANELTGDGGSEVVNQLTLLSNNELVSVTPGTFIKEESTLSSMFDGVVPEGVAEGISDIYFGHYLDMIVDKAGRVYTRSKTTDEFFEFDKFLPEPLAYLNPETNEYEVLEGIRLLPNGISTESCLLYDTKKNRMFLAWDFYYEPDFGGDGYVIGRLDPVTSALNSEWPSGVPTIDQVLADYEMVYIAPYREGYTDTSGSYFAVIKDKASGDFYQYEFALNKTWGSASVYLTSSSYVKMLPKVVELFTNPNNVITTLKLRAIGYESGNIQTASLTFIAEANSLYAYNRNAAGTGSDLQLLYTADSPIVSMACMESSSWSKYLGVAYEDGSFEIITAINAQYDGMWDGHIWKSEGIDLGEPISLYFAAPYDINW